MTTVRGTRVKVRRRSGAFVVWLAAFFSPTGYCLLLVAAARFHVPAPTDPVAVALFFLVPVVGLLVCGQVIWWSRQSVPRRIGWGIVTLGGILFQVGVLLAIFAAIIAAIGYAQ